MKTLLIFVLTKQSIMTANKISLRELSDKIFEYYNGSNLDMSAYEEVFDEMIEVSGWEFRGLYELEFEEFDKANMYFNADVKECFYDTLNGSMTPNKVYNICSQYLK